MVGLPRVTLDNGPKLRSLFFFLIRGNSVIFFPIIVHAKLLCREKGELSIGLHLCPLQPGPKGLEH